jgi:hypothetical protein
MKVDKIEEKWSWIWKWCKLIRKTMPANARAKRLEKKSSAWET